MPKDPSATAPNVVDRPAVRRSASPLARHGEQRVEVEVGQGLEPQVGGEVLPLQQRVWDDHAIEPGSPSRQGTITRRPIIGITDRERMPS